MAIDIEYNPRTPEVDVQLSASFTVPSVFVPSIIETLLKQLPLTASVEIEAREVVENRSEHTNGSAT